MKTGIKTGRTKGHDIESRDRCRYEDRRAEDGRRTPCAIEAKYCDVNVMQMQMMSQ